MSNPVVYKDSPLGDYLEGTGTYDNDWGVSSDHESSEEGGNEVAPAQIQRDFAPPSRLPTRKFVTRELKPLIIANENDSRTAKFYSLFTTSFSSHVPPPETARFQERLRYIICTSQLLSEKITPSLYPDSPIEDHADILFRKRTLRYWIGTGGCVIVVGLLVSWTLRNGKASKEPKARNLAALAVGLLIAVYLYAHTRRRYTRLLRAKTLNLVESLVRNSHAFDTVIHQTLQYIQEVELVSRGYRLSSAFTPITRLEQSSTLRRCSNLRATLSASLTLATSSLHRTSLILTEFATQSLLQQMHQVYNIDDTLPSDLPEIPSLADLKATCIIMHERRRQLLCALLAIHVEPYNPAWSTWRTVVRELNRITRILGDFTRELARSLEDEQLFEIPQPVVGRVNVSDHARGLSSLSANIKTITAKMALLKQDVTSSLSSIPESSRQSVFDTYDSIGQDLHALLNDWQTGRNDLIRLFSPQDAALPETDESVADSGLGVSLADSVDPPKKRDSCSDWGVAFPSVTPLSPCELEGIFEENVLEGMAKGKSGIGLTRAERIEKARKEREDLAERKRIAEERGRWIGELKNVLGQRRR